MEMRDRSPPPSASSSSSSSSSIKRKADELEMPMEAADEPAIPPAVGLTDEEADDWMKELVAPLGGHGR